MCVLHSEFKAVTPIDCIHLDVLSMPFVFVRFFTSKAITTEQMEANVIVSVIFIMLCSFSAGCFQTFHVPIQFVLYCVQQKHSCIHTYSERILFVCFIMFILFFFLSSLVAFLTTEIAILSHDKLAEYRKKSI